jgi:hypothetical protein
MDNEPFDVDERAPGAAGHIGEFLACDRIPGSVEGGHQKDGSIQVQALRKRRRSDDDLDGAFGKENLELAQERAWKTPMMDCDATLEADDSGMIFAQPLAADFEGTRDVPLVLQKRI